MPRGKKEYKQDLEKWMDAKDEEWRERIRLETERIYKEGGEEGVEVCLSILPG